MDGSSETLTAFSSLIVLGSAKKPIVTTSLALPNEQGECYAVATCLAIER